MTPTPLTPARRQAIEKRFGFWDCACTDERDAKPCLRCEVNELLAAEQYWRETVRNAKMEVEYADLDWCAFCDESEDHKPGCPWLLANQH